MLGKCPLVFTNKLEEQEINILFITARVRNILEYLVRSFWS
jgi:hypothetical protein